MDPGDFLTVIIDTGLRVLHAFGGPASSDDTRRFVLCVAMQETELSARYQNAPDPEPGEARSWWQFERAGVNGVMTHASSQDLARTACDRLAVVFETEAVWRSLEGNSLLACMFARLLLLTDPYPIPTNVDDAWTCYADRLWRPGAPHPETWWDNWAIADQTVRDRPL